MAFHPGCHPICCSNALSSMLVVLQVTALRPLPLPVAPATTAAAAAVLVEGTRRRLLSLQMSVSSEHSRVGWGVDWGQQAKEHRPAPGSSGGSCGQCQLLGGGISTSCMCYSHFWCPSSACGGVMQDLPKFEQIWSKCVSWSSALSGVQGRLLRGRERGAGRAPSSECPEIWQSSS